MLIVKRKFSWSESVSLALCEEVRVTEKRVYANPIKGDRVALEGRTGNTYASIEDVLTFNATEAMFDEMVTALRLHEQAIDAMRRQIVIQRKEFEQSLQLIANQ